MDRTHDIPTLPNAVVAKQRFESFRLGNNLSSQHRPKSFHGRSHSRNTSLCSSASLPSLLQSNSNNSTTDMPTLPSLHISLPPPQKRPNSHHRRRSSVSTRHESAEMMGVSLPDLPASTSDDNVNFGEKDSIRRRALWALEGKPDVAFTKVEIPELTTPDIEDKTFDFPTRPSFPPGFGGGSMMGNKRDSFKLLGSTGSSKDQLHTLMEEEEEEEEEKEKGTAENKENISSSPVSEVPALPEPTPSIIRQRPANLNLRPLSLTPENLSHVPSSLGLSTPAQTPCSSHSFPLKALALIPSHATDVDTNTTPALPTRRNSLILPSPAPTPTTTRRPSLNINCESHCPSGDDEHKFKRRSSISYKTSYGSTCLSIAGLPTPDGTPTLSEGRRLSFSSSSDEDFSHHRPLSTSEQHFLFKSHNALLARITDLEHALSSRQSRPLSVSSDVSSNFSPSEPSDEMLQLIADLKAERDELTRDVEGWRTRVGDLERQVGVFAKRVEVERRDAWVARSRVGLLDVEKSTLERKLEEKDRLFHAALEKSDALERKCAGLMRNVAELQALLEKSQEIQGECVGLRIALEEERKRRNNLERELDRVNMMTTPTVRTRVSSQPAWMNRGLGFTSVDSSVTDVEFSDDSLPKAELKMVVEEDEEAVGNASVGSDDNGLARYEDAEDSDLSFRSLDSSSLGSMNEFPRSTLHLQRSLGPSPPCVSASPMPSSCEVKPTHSTRASLSKTWTFPMAPTVVSRRRDADEVDRFFGCLADIDNSPPIGGVTPSHDNGKGLFAQAFGTENEDELLPFVLPNGVGIEVEDPLGSPHSLDSVVEGEEKENDDVEQGLFGEEINGIRITFTPPEPEHELLKPEIPVEPATWRHVPFEQNEEDAHKILSTPFTGDEDEDGSTFNFGRPTSPKADSPVRTQKVSPSSIPRFSPSKSFIASQDVITSSPPMSRSARFSYGHSANICVTPSTKRGGTVPSFIPQVVSSTSPKKESSAVKPNPVRRASFIRQPQRKPAPVAPPINSNGNEPMNAFCRSSYFSTSEAPVSDPSEVKNETSPQQYPQAHASLSSINAAATVSSSSSFIASPFAARLSFQTFTNFIPFPWSASRSQVLPASSTVSSRNTCGEQSSFVRSPIVSEKREPRFVSKGRQLEKLRSRLEQEQAQSMSKR